MVAGSDGAAPYTHTTTAEASGCASRVRASALFLATIGPMLPTARVPDNLPTPTNSFVIFVVLCLFIFGLMAFAKFMQQRERKRRG